MIAFLAAAVWLLVGFVAWSFLKVGARGEVSEADIRTLYADAKRGDQRQADVLNSPHSHDGSVTR